MRYKYPLLFSVLMHLLPFMHLPGHKGSGQGSGPVQVHVNIIEKLPEHSKVTKSKKDDCAKWFGGVGIEFNGLFGDDGNPNRITHVFKGYPASKYLKVGDIITSDVPSIKGKPGTPVTIQVFRDGQYLTFTIKRDKICIMEPHDDAP